MIRLRNHLVVILIMLLISALVFAAGCGPEAEPDQPDTEAEAPDETEEEADEPEPEPEMTRGPMTWSTRGDPVWLNPVLERSGGDIRTNRLMFDRLFVLDEDAMPEPQLAADYEVSAGGLEYTVNLVDAKWHDGTQLTAHDVVFTYRLHLDPSVPSRYESDLWALVGAEAILDGEADFDDYEPVIALSDSTVLFRLSEPYVPFVPTALTLGIVPKHLLEDCDDITECEFNQQPIGSGPLKFVYWERDDHLQFEGFEDYHQGTPGITDFTLRVIPDATVQIMELETESIHGFVLATKDAYDHFYERPGFQVFSRPSFGYSTLAFVNDHPLWEDVRVRKAIAYATNREEAVREYVGLELGQLAWTPIPPISWAHNPNLEPLPYDPEKAMELLNDAGWHKDSAGVLRNEAGEPFEFAFETFRAVERSFMNVIFQENLRELGIQASVSEMAAADLLYKMHEAKYPDVTFITWGMSPDPDGEMWRRFHSSEKDWNNFWNYSNDRVDELLEKARRETDTDLRRDYYFEIQEILLEDMPGVTVFWRNDVTGFTDSVRGLRFGANGWKDFVHQVWIDQ